MNAMLPTYSFDTGGLIDGLERYYPVDNFPALWDRIDELIAVGRFIISEEVWQRGRAQDDKAA